MYGTSTRNSVPRPYPLRRYITDLEVFLHADVLKHIATDFTSAKRQRWSHWRTQGTSGTDDGRNTNPTVLSVLLNCFPTDSAGYLSRSNRYSTATLSSQPFHDHCIDKLLYINDCESCTANGLNELRSLRYCRISALVVYEVWLRDHSQYLTGLPFTSRNLVR